MAYRPSKRGRHPHEEGEANITPMMNLMVVLIPLLLTSAEFVKLGVIELNLPPAAKGPAGQQLEAMPSEDIQKLDLTVTITDRGFFISSSLAVLSGDLEGEPTIPCFSGAAGSDAYDYTTLSNKLFEIKSRAADSYPDSEQIIILAEPEIDYQTLISTMDASRTVVRDGSRESLFPDVSLSAGVF